MFRHHSIGRFTLVVLAAIGMLAVATPPGEAADPAVITETVAYTADGAIQGYLARPADETPRPGLILIHEWWGLNDNMRANAREFAKAGYVALAVDLYQGQVATTPEQARQLAASVRQNMRAAFANLRQAVNYLRQRTALVIPDRLASVGWCFGGGWSYQMAKNNLGVKGSVIYYGFFNPEDDLSKMRSTILGHFGEEDRVIRIDNVREFQVKLKALGGGHEIYIYPNTGHAFANPQSPNYDRQAAELAWQRTVAFLKQYL